MQKLKILFTSVGRRVELMEAFRAAAKQLAIDLEIWGADITETAPALFFCDKKVQVCRIRDERYILSWCHPIYFSLSLTCITRTYFS